MVRQSDNPDAEKGAKRTPDNSPCNECGKLGHWVCDCPNKKLRGSNNSGGRFRGRGNGNGGDHHHGRPPNRNGATNWKKQAPKPGKPQNKVVQGKPWQWCEKCGRWSTTHGTDQHIKGKPDSPQANTLYLDPGAWSVEFDLTFGPLTFLLALYDIIILTLRPHALPMLFGTIGYWWAQLQDYVWPVVHQGLVTAGAHLCDHWSLHPLPIL